MGEKIYLGKILIKILNIINIDLKKIKFNYSRDNSVISIKVLIKIDVCDLGLLDFRHLCLRLASHYSTTPVASDLIKAIVVIRLNTVTELVKVMLVLLPSCSQTNSAH